MVEEKRQRIDEEIMDLSNSQEESQHETNQSCKLSPIPIVPVAVVHVTDEQISMMNEEQAEVVIDELITNLDRIVTQKERIVKSIREQVSIKLRERFMVQLKQQKADQ